MFKREDVHLIADFQCVWKTKQQELQQNNTLRENSYSGQTQHHQQQKTTSIEMYSFHTHIV